MTEHDQPTVLWGVLPPKILIVEDDRETRDAMRRYLQLHGYDVDCAVNAEEAIPCALRAPPAVVICDWQLGGRQDGVTVAEILQERYGASVILVTGHRLDHLRQRAEKVRVASFLRKPVALNVLADVVFRELHH